MGNREIRRGINQPSGGACLRSRVRLASATEGRNRLHKGKGKKVTEEYNGWKNRETWATNLWIENDQGLQEEALEMAKNAVREDKLNATRILADNLKEWLETLLDFRAYREEYGAEMSDGLQTMRDDIGSLYRVDWWEIAEGFLSSVLEDEEVSA